ncbi:MAG: ATP-binding protein [Xanthomonadales bacterium]|nr:ATP-binding protein [Xanthomonadales bacterium]
MPHTSEKPPIRQRLAGLIWWPMAVAFTLFVVAYLPGLRSTVLGEFVFNYSFSFLCPLVILAAFFELDRMHGQAEKVFWRLVGAAFLMWIAADAIPYGSEDSSSVIAGLVSDAFYTAFFLLLLLATHRRPDRPARYHPEIERVRDLSAVALTLSMFVFWILIPAIVDASHYESLFPSYALFLSLDVVLVVRLATLFVLARQRRWQLIYCLLGIAALLWLISDLNWAMVYNLGLPEDVSAVGDLTVVISFLLVLSAILVRGWDDSGELHSQHGEVALQSGVSAPGALILVVCYTLVTPLVQVSSAIAGPTGHAMDEPRLGLTVAVTLLFAAAIAFLLIRMRTVKDGEFEVRISVSDEQLQHSQRMESLGRLAGGVAHDFNNVLTVILGYAHMIQNAGDSGPRQRSGAGKIQAAAENARSLTLQLLAFSRKQVLDPTVIDLNDMIVDTNEMVERLLDDEISVQVHTSQQPCTVRADAGQITQVLFNLTTNAQSAMPQGGELEISTSIVEIGDGIGDLDVAAGRYVLLTVSDTGKGMDQETLNHIFEPFYSRSTGGTGLGLAMVYGIVDQSGGFLDVKSAIGRGTTFRIFLPWVEEEKEKMAPSEAAPTGAGGDETLLVVEDDAGVREMISSHLKSKGYRVLEAPHGQSAMELLERHPQVDLVVTDITMPEMGGPEFADQLVRSRPEVPVLAISGHADRPGDCVSGSSIRAFLQKPFSMDLLDSTIRELLS